ncbi:MAG: hypothetical protein NT154_17015 [Verrucomicrobia bacterium]|nr:hypothetical protein [Verrucomicrobiota bacterium]
MALLASRLTRAQPLSPGISTEAAGQESAVTALPGRALALALWPQSEPFELLVWALEMPSTLLWVEPGPATAPPMASEASRLLPLWEVAQQALLVLAFSQRLLPLPPLC